MALFGPARRAIGLAASALITGALPAAAQKPNLEGGRAQTATPETDARSDAGESSTTRDRRTDHLRVGVLGGVGFPRPLAIEGFVKIERIVGLGVEYSALPSLTIEGVRTSFWAVAGDARVFPLRGPFFAGVRAGHQHLGGTTAVTVGRYGTFTETATVGTTFVNPRAGFLWTWEPGISVGFDAGVQIPLSSRTESTLPASLASLANDPRARRGIARVKDVAHTLGDRVLPTVDLLRVGALF